MKQYLLESITILFLFTFSSFSTQAQTTGQFLLNGDISFFSNNDKSGRTIPERINGGQEIPAIDYVFQQYASNLTLNPRLHYFLNEKWSVGVAMGFRQIITRRFLDEFQISTPSEYISFSTPSKVQNTTYSYSPKIEVTRHWKLTERFSINLTGVVNWRWVSLTVEQRESLGLTRVEELTTWAISQDELTFTPDNQIAEKTKTKEQFWAISFVPQIRYAIKPRFGLTAAFGGVSLSQQVKDDEEGFLRAAPNLSVRMNPNSWTLGVYGVFGGGEESL